jgi:leucyl-tRNA synthetase
MRTSHGMILGENGEKMSKSRGNVVNPDEIVAEFGADTLRLYEMFIGDFEKAAPWNSASIKGCKRFLERVAGLSDLVSGTGETEAITSLVHKTVKKVSQDIEDMKFNTAIAAMMTLINGIYEHGSLTKDELGVFVRLLCPFAPHICEEMWEALGNKGLCAVAPWPEYDEAKTQDATVEIAVQICGKVKSTIRIAADAKQDEAIAAAKADEKIAALLDGKTIVKEIYVPGKILNIVAK